MKARKNVSNMRYNHFDKFRSSSADRLGNKRVCIANMTHPIGWNESATRAIAYLPCSCLQKLIALVANRRV